MILGSEDNMITPVLVTLLFNVKMNAQGDSINEFEFGQ